MSKYNVGPQHFSDECNEMYWHINVGVRHCTAIPGHKGPHYDGVNDFSWPQKSEPQAEQPPATERDVSPQKSEGVTFSSVSESLRQHFSRRVYHAQDGNPVQEGYLGVRVWGPPAPGLMSPVAMEMAREMTDAQFEAMGRELDVQDYWICSNCGKSMPRDGRWYCDECVARATQLKAGSSKHEPKCAPTCGPASPCLDTEACIDRNAREREAYINTSRSLATLAEEALVKQAHRTGPPEPMRSGLGMLADTYRYALSRHKKARLGS